MLNANVAIIGPNRANYCQRIKHGDVLQQYGYDTTLIGKAHFLEADPGEFHNCWDDPEYAAIKCRLFQRFVNAEVKREPARFPQIANA